MIKRLTPFALVIAFAAIAFSSVDVHAQKRSRSPSKAKVVIEHKSVLVEAGDTLTTIATRAGVNPIQVARLNGLSLNTKLKKGQQLKVPPPVTPEAVEAASDQRQPNGKLIKFDDGSTVHVDDAWWRGAEVWYALGKVTAVAPRKVKSIETVYVAQVRSKNDVTPPKIVPVETKPETASTWIYLHGGAKFKVDQVKEQADGAWYQRGNLLSFLDRTRIARIERDLPGVLPSDWKERGWTSGNATIDGLIRTNGSRFGVDPYLVFLVIEQESHFRTRAVSPKGARGLMQLMPGTARRFGVTQSFDPVQNIRGGTQYLKELLGMFNGRVDLALASYNAGEGRVIQYGNKVPPFRETREYVKRIGSRYGSGASDQRNQRKPRTGG